MKIGVVGVVIESHWDWVGRVEGGGEDVVSVGWTGLGR